MSSDGTKSGAETLAKMA